MAVLLSLATLAADGGPWGGPVGQTVPTAPPGGEQPPPKPTNTRFVVVPSPTATATASATAAATTEAAVQSTARSTQAPTKLVLTPTDVASMVPAVPPEASSGSPAGLWALLGLAGVLAAGAWAWLRRRRTS